VAIEIRHNSVNRENGLSLTFIHALEERKKKILSKDKLAILPRDNRPATLPGSSEKGIFFVTSHLLYAIALKRSMFSLKSHFLLWQILGP
jgi:hypothetical protein